MNRNDFLVALFGRPVWFHCKRCQRVKVVETEDASKETWQDQAEAMGRYGVCPEDLWWFDTVCDPCQIRQSR